MSEQLLNEFFDEEPPTTEEQIQQLGRRRFLSGAVAGGVSGLVVAVGASTVVWNTTGQARADLEAAQAEIERLQGLVALYEDLEKIGIDGILAAGIKALAFPLEAIEAGAKALKAGLDWAEEALLSIQEALPSAEESILWLESQVDALAEGIEKLEKAIGNALDKAADSVLGEAVRDFATLILDNLPFGLGDKIREVLDGLVHLVTSVDDLINGINIYVLEPIRQKWFASEEGEGVGATFLNPLVEKVFDPLEAHLADLSTLADTWQQEFLAPTEQAIAERAKVQEDISRYKEETGLA
jgi:prefoldin subunit 5